MVLPKKYIRFDSQRVTDLERAFGLREREADFAPLRSWLEEARILPDLNAFEKLLIPALQNALTHGVSYWNEAELKIEFIGPLLKAARFDELNVLGARTFYDRTLRATPLAADGPLNVGGVADFFVGKREGLPR